MDPVTGIFIAYKAFKWLTRTPSPDPTPPDDGGAGLDNIIDVIL